MKTRKLILILIASSLFGILSVSILYSFSEEIIHRNNSFIRRYPHHPVTKKNSFDLGFNSYYIAGITKDSVYLGNYSAPLHILAIDQDLQDSTHITLQLEGIENFNFRSGKIQVHDSLFYFYDGTVPIIYHGKSGEWNGKILFVKEAFFSQIIPSGINQFAIRVRRASTNENELGMIKILEDSVHVSIHSELLKKQLDGIFDTDGFLLFNKSLQRVIYPYKYRNQFIVATPDMDLNYVGESIDTIQTAQLELFEIPLKNQTKVGRKSVKVNLGATTTGKYLFLISDRLGKYEPAEMLSQASIVDVYNVREKTYEMSFYLYHHNKIEIRGIEIWNDQLFGIAGNYLVNFKLKPEHFNFQFSNDISADIRSQTENLK